MDQFNNYVMPKTGINPATGKVEFYKVEWDSYGNPKKVFMGDNQTRSIGRFDGNGNDMGQFALLEDLETVIESTKSEDITWVENWNRYAGLPNPDELQSYTIFITQYASSVNYHNGSEGGSNNYAVPGNIIPGGGTEGVIPSVEIKYHLNDQGKIVVDFTNEMNNMSITMVDNITGEHQTLSLEEFYTNQGYIINKIK